MKAECKAKLLEYDGFCSWCIMVYSRLIVSMVVGVAAGKKLPSVV